MNKVVGCQCGPRIRFLVLVFICIMSFCGMSMYDIPGSLQKAIMNNYSLSAFQFSLLYSLYSWPSVAMCFFGGFIIDRFLGVTMASTLFAGIQMVGISIFTLGGFLDTLWVMLLGRFIFGIGGEMCGVCIVMFLLLWFKGKELNTVSAVMQNILRLGTSGVYLVSTPLLETLRKNLSSSQALNFTLLILSSTSVFPLLLSIILTFMDPIRTKNKNCKESNDQPKTENLVNDIRLSDIKQLPITFWILSLSINLYNHSLYTFLAFTQEFFTTEFHLSVEGANQMSSLFNIIPVILATFLGIIVDKVGRNMIFMLSAVVVGIAAHSFAVTLCSRYLIIVSFSISNSLMMSAYLPTIAYTVDKSHQGTAYGINQSLYNLVLSCGSLMAGWIINDYGFHSVEIYYLICSSVVLCAFLLLWKLDSNRKNVLNMNFIQRQNYEESL